MWIFELAPFHPNHPSIRVTFFFLFFIKEVPLDSTTIHFHLPVSFLSGSFVLPAFRKGVEAEPRGERKGLRRWQRNKGLIRRFLCHLGLGFFCELIAEMGCGRVWHLVVAVAVVVVVGVGVWGLLASVAPGTLLDVQNVGLNPRLAECFHFRKISRWFCACGSLRSVELVVKWFIARVYGVW